MRVQLGHARVQAEQRRDGDVVEAVRAWEVRRSTTNAIARDRNTRVHAQQMHLSRLQAHEQAPFVCVQAQQMHVLGVHASVSAGHASVSA